MEPHLFIREFGDLIYHVHIKDTLVNLHGTEGILGSFLTFGDVRRGWNLCPRPGSVDFELMSATQRHQLPRPVVGRVGGQCDGSCVRCPKACEMVKQIDFAVLGRF